MQKALRFAYGETRSGTVVIAVGDQGVAAVFLGDNQARLHRELVRVFPQAEWTEDAEALAETLAKVVAAVNAPGSDFDLPLDIQGSDVEMAVWQALRQIPVGESAVTVESPRRSQSPPQRRTSVQHVRPMSLR
jgi:AraC family transcriptional regulator of adaptative response/methylated-DNA-[protein]-cysteine methyltransferase